MNNKKYVESIETEVRKAAHNGELNYLKELLSNILIKSKSLEDQQYLINSLAYEASSEGQLEIIKYLFSNNELNILPEIHDTNENFLGIACAEGHLNIVKYLLTSNQLKEKANINANGTEKPLVMACLRGNIEIIEYLTTSKELNKHSNININFGEVLLIAWTNKHINVAQYLIFDRQINKTEKINDRIKKDINLKSLFDKRDLNNKLIANLDDDKLIKKSKKL